MDRTLILLLIQGAKTFLVSLFIVYIFHRLVTRHLLSIARFVGRYDLDVSAPTAQPANAYLQSRR